MLSDLTLSSNARSATVELRMLNDPGTHRLFRPEEIVNASSTSRRAAVLANCVKW